jgi:predicted DNA-binding transcriptional regulator YafY
MANTSSRTLRLLSLLQTHRYWPGEELARRLGVSIRTLRRDVDRLRELGYPVRASRGVDGGYQLEPGAELPPLVLDDEEAVALAVGLQAAAQGSVAGIAESSVRALAKIVGVMPPRLRRRVEALRAMTLTPGWGDTGAAADPETLVTVARACRDSERLEFGYAAADGARTERHVEPLRLVHLGRRWYLVGYDLGRQNWRSFRVDRVERPRGTGARFRPRELPADDAAAFVRAGLRNLPTSHSVEAVVCAPAAEVRQRIGRWAEVNEEEPRRCRVRMRSDALEWPAMALGSLRAEFTVLGPPELVEQLREWSDLFARAATESPARSAPQPPADSAPGKSPAGSPSADLGADR